MDGKDSVGWGRATGRLSLRPPAPWEVPAALELHAREIGHPPGGPRTPGRRVGRSVERYHRAFLESPHAACLVTVEDRGAKVLGFLLASLDASAHRAFVLRRHGVWLAGRALARAVRGPGAYGPPQRARLDGLAPGTLPPVHPRCGIGGRVGGLACVVVDPDWRGLGIGAALVRAYETQARRAGLGGLIATAHDWPEAAPFLTRLGWHPANVANDRARSSKVSAGSPEAGAGFYARPLPGKARSGCR